MLTTKVKQLFLVGIIGGIVIRFLVKAGIKHHFSTPENNQHDTEYYESELFSSNTALLLVGVQTSGKYLETRMKAVYETWAHVPGDVKFFAGEESTVYSNLLNIPLVSLPGVQDNMYPPQKKSFLMLKYMHDYFIDKYEWFIRADDDSFLIGPKLGKFLSSINSSELHYIGQYGKGRKEEEGQLGLDQNMAFCMGGPGVILSRETLAKVVPHMESCLEDLFSSHEDTELGRCINKFVGILCTKAFDVGTPKIIYTYTF